MNRFWIYTLLEPVNFKHPSNSEWIVRYVGYTNDPSERYKTHLKECWLGRSHKEKWIRSLIQQGIIPKMEIVDWGETKMEIENLEKEYVRLFRTICSKELTNGDGGGRGGKVLTAETRKKISDSKRGKNLSDFHKNQISKALSGDKNPFYGRQHTAETKAFIGQNNKFNVNKPILQLDLNTGEVIKQWNSTYEIFEALRIDNSSITKCCKGKRFSAGGFRWSYFSEPII